MIEVYTANTPNGIKIPILLEELGVPYRVTGMNLSNKDQKRTSFLKINPNGRIPAIVDSEVLDKSGSPLTVFESGAIMLYLAEKYSGLLGESVEDRLGLLVQLATQDPHPESVPINALVRVEGTPLADEAPIDSIEFVRIIATARIMMPASFVRLSAGRTAC